MVNVETVSIVFTGLSVSLAAFYYMSTLRNAQKTQQLQLETRQAQLFMQVYDRFTGEEFKKHYSKFMYQMDWDDVDEYVNKYGIGTDDFITTDILVRSSRASGCLYGEG